MKRMMKVCALCITTSRPRTFLILWVWKSTPPPLIFQNMKEYLLHSTLFTNFPEFADADDDYQMALKLSMEGLYF